MTLMMDEETMGYEFDCFDRSAQRPRMDEKQGFLLLERAIEPTTNNTGQVVGRGRGRRFGQKNRG